MDQPRELQRYRFLHHRYGDVETMATIAIVIVRHARRPAVSAAHRSTTEGGGPLACESRCPYRIH
ncbi:hypothetical protein RA307_20640, partial [Xanthobacteraceae bacterium Astr-EGSB]|uniref:hypothetical protein n=1 Tax=Astrobacterium formosum TaxID=3069710 RepID=UPI0027B84772|nr:hypothetical protein [Xanthobacteraceae bacterium Astr-EGSB]